MPTTDITNTGHVCSHRGLEPSDGILDHHRLFRAKARFIGDIWKQVRCWFDVLDEIYTIAVGTKLVNTPSNSHRAFKTLHRTA